MSHTSRSSPLVERLEHRRLLSVSLGEDGVLTITGTPHSDHIRIYATNYEGLVASEGSSYATLWVHMNGRTDSFSLDQVQKIKVDAKAGHDDVRLDESGYAIGKPATLIGGDGKDTLAGGSADDLLMGDAGPDKLVGYGGNDTLIGGTGNDRATGCAGDDSLLGEGGNDYLAGCDGNDSLNGGSGNDRLLGGVGDDSLDGGNSRDMLDGGAGADEIHGGPGVDHLHGGADNDLFHGTDSKEIQDQETGDTFVP